jgi:hypothetical protein
MLTKKYSWHNHRIFNKPEKETKERPPRIFKRGTTRYIRPGKHKVRVSDLNLIIKNYIGKPPRRTATKRGGDEVKQLKALALKAREDRATLEKMMMLKQISDQKANEELRVAQIKQEALANNERERQALQAAHRRELADLKRDVELANREVIREIQNRTKAVIELERDLDIQLTKQNPFFIATQRTTSAASPSISGVDDNIPQHRVNQAERYDQRERRRVDIEDEEALPPEALPIAKARQTKEERLAALNLANKLGRPKQRKALVAQMGQQIEKELMAQQQAPQRGMPAQAAADPILDNPQPDEINGEGLATHNKKMGLTNYQINDMMSDEPCYLTTCSADEIPTLKHLAQIALDEYGQCGFIVNIDPRDVQVSEHWVAIYIDVDKEKVCFYYDPFGEPPTPLIANGLKQLIVSLKLPYYLASQYNQEVNQDNNSSRCGIHAMMVLTSLFAGMSTEKATDNNEEAAQEFERYI